MNGTGTGTSGPRCGPTAGNGSKPEAGRTFPTPQARVPGSPATSVIWIAEGFEQTCYSVLDGASRVLWPCAWTNG